MRVGDSDTVRTKKSRNVARMSGALRQVLVALVQKGLKRAVIFEAMPPTLPGLRPKLDVLSGDEGIHELLLLVFDFGNDHFFADDVQTVNASRN